MNQLITFAVEFLLVSSVFYLGFLIIKNHTRPTFKRFYLLAWLIFSIAFPLISFESEQSLDMSVSRIVRDASQRPAPKAAINHDQILTQPDLDLQSIESIKSTGSVANSKGSWLMFLIGGYCLISALLLGRIILGIIQIFRLKANSERIETSLGYVFLVNKSTFKGASFFKWIFIGKSIDQEFEMIHTHEYLHSKLGHSMDILVTHLYCSLLWINPFSWILKRLVSLNTELETDAKMLQVKNNKETYASALLSLSNGANGAAIMNHFGAFHLKSRIMELSKEIRHKNWVSAFTITTVIGLFFLVSCEHVNSSEMMVERLNDVKTITTRFISHQSDTQQKTGKIVAIASFSPEGSLEEMIEQTTYPYDREYEVKKVFWEAPEKTGVAFIMDGLSLGNAEKSFLYGHDWPSAYYKHLYARTQSMDMPWNETVEVDDENLPREIAVRKDFESNKFIGFGMPDVTEYFEYEDQKVVNVLSKTEYNNLEVDDEQIKSLNKLVDKNIANKQRENMAKMIAKSGKIKLMSTYEYDGDLLTSIKKGDAERRFYYENNLMVKSEYLRSGEIINTRIHYYKNSLKDRTEIFNRYNEPEYTITYEYEFW